MPIFFSRPTLLLSTWLSSVASFILHWTKMYPMALMRFSPLSACAKPSAWLPHVLESSGIPPVPKPILESQVLQSFSLLPRIPILALAQRLWSATTLNPSLLQLVCKEAWEPISDFHVLRPSEVARYCPSAINEYRDIACFVTKTVLICWLPTFIARQILGPVHTSNFTWAEPNTY